MTAACTLPFTMSPGNRLCADDSAFIWVFLFLPSTYLVDWACLLIIFHICEGREHLHRCWRITETSLPGPRPGRSWARRAGAIVTMPVPEQDAAAGCEAFSRHCPSVDPPEAFPDRHPGPVRASHAHWTRWGWEAVAMCLSAPRAPLVRPAGNGDSRWLQTS